MKTSLGNGTTNTGAYGTTTALSIDPENHEHVIDKLTDLYSDRAGAAIREAATNAWDAHRDAGHAQPIEVTLPTEWSPSFVVRDYGTGMTTETLLEVYSKYGASTKRESNEVVGMLGFGSKAPLAYATQFSVVSTVGGVTTTVLVFRGEDGVGLMSEPLVETTGLPNGTTISVPVDEVEVFAAKARRFFAFWESGSVLIDGVATTSLFDVQEDENGHRVLRLDDDVLVVHRGQTPGAASVAVMGNVAYPIPEFEASDAYVNWPWVVVVRVPIGSVDVVPSREALKATAKTAEVTDALRQYVRETVVKRAQEMVAQAETGPEAVALSAVVRDLLVPRAHKGALIWRGQAIPTHARRMLLPHRGAYRIVAANLSTTATAKKHEVYRRTLNVPERVQVVAFVSGCGTGSVSSYYKQAVMDAVETAHGPFLNTMLVCAPKVGAPDTTWLDPAHKVLRLTHADMKSAAKALRPKAARTGAVGLADWDPETEVRMADWEGRYSVTPVATLVHEVMASANRSGVVVLTPSEAGGLAERGRLVRNLDERVAVVPKAQRAKVVAALEAEGLEVLSPDGRRHQKVEHFVDGLTEEEAARVVQGYELDGALDTARGLLPYGFDISALEEFGPAYATALDEAKAAWVLSKRWNHLRGALPEGDPYRALFPRKVPADHPVHTAQALARQAVAAFPLMAQFHRAGAYAQERYIALERAARTAGVTV